MNAKVIDLQSPGGDLKTLNNDYHSRMEIDSETWTSPTQYAYANSIPVEYYQFKTKKDLENIIFSSTSEIIKNEPYWTFVKNTHLAINSVVFKALEKGMSVKLQNTDVMKKLLSTKDKDIIFLTKNDKLLGISDYGKGSGDNLVGKVLVQIRTYYQRLAIRKKEEEEAQQNLKKYFEASVLYKLLQSDIRNGRSGLQNYLNLNSLADISSLYVRETSQIFGSADMKNEQQEARKDTLHNTLDSSQEFEYFKRKWEEKDHTVYPQMRNFALQPHTMIVDLRSNYLQAYKVAVESRMKDLLFDMYMDYMISTHYPDVMPTQYKAAKKQQLAKISGRELEEMKEQLYLNREELPADFFSVVRNKISKVYIPTQEDIDEATRVSKMTVLTPLNVDIMDEGFVREDTVKDVVPITYDVDKVTGKRFRDIPWSLERNSIVMLSPYTYTGQLVIDNISFPSVMHYVGACLFQMLPTVKTLSNAQRFLYIPGTVYYRTFEELYSTYQYNYDRYQQKSLVENVRKAMDEKFLNRRFRRDLVEFTGNKQFIWKSDDPVLGTGKYKNGTDEVGRYMSVLREKFRSLIRAEDAFILTNTNFWETIQTDSFMMKWFEKKVHDVLNTCRKIRKYSALQHNLKIPMNKNLVEVVTELIYTPCGDALSDNAAEVPLFFVEIVRKELHTSSQLALISSFFWKRFSSMIYYASKLSDGEKVSLHQLKSTIEAAEDNLSSSLTLCNAPQSKEEEATDGISSSCVVQALVNLLKAIVKYNRQSASLELIPVQRPYGVSLKIGSREIDLAASIILNTYQGQMTDTPDIIVEEIETEADQRVQEDLEDENDRDGAGSDSLFRASEIADYIMNVQELYDLNPVTGRKVSNVGDHKEIARRIVSTVDYILAYKMDKKVKKNRVNFFA